MSEIERQTPVTVLPELERMLVEQASRRALATAAAAAAFPETADAPLASPTAGVPTTAPASVPARRRRRRISRRSSALALLVALVVGSAIAAVRPWSPLLGNDHGGHPSVSQTSPGEPALRLLGVLRRAQTVADRDAQTAATLRLVGPQLHGVRVRWIRNLERDVAGMAVTLVPVETYGDVGEATLRAREGGFLCVLYPSSRPAPNASLHCFSPAEIASGRAVGVARSEGVVHVFGLVPDGVASVSVALADGRRSIADVHGNFFDVTGSASFARVLAVRWRDAGGRRVWPPPIGAAPGQGQSAR